VCWTRNRVLEGIGPSDGWGLGKRALVYIFYTCKPYLHTLGSICLSSGMENTRQCSRGEWALEWWVLGVKGELLSRASYTLLRGISLDMPQFRYGKHSTVFARGFNRGPPRPRAGRSEIESEFLVSCVLYVAGRYLLERIRLLCQKGCSPNRKLPTWVISGPDCSLFGKAV